METLIKYLLIFFYFQYLKAKPSLTEADVKYVKKTLEIITKKFRFDEEYNFDHEGEDEALFMEYRYKGNPSFLKINRLSKFSMI